MGNDAVGLMAGPGPAAEKEGAASPHARLMDLSLAMVPARCLQVVAKMGVANALPLSGGSLERLATAVGADADALSRVLRLLESYGIFEVDGTFVQHTELSKLLRADHPASMEAFAHMIGLPFHWDVIGELELAVRTGRAPLKEPRYGGIWNYLDGHPDERAVFDAAMTAKSQGDIGAVLAAYDFGRHRVVADIGGGRGHLLNGIAERHPDVTGVLVDLPGVIERVAAERPAASTMVLHPADFFVDPLPSADAYVLMEVLHDWDDEDAVRILTSVRQAAPAGAVLLVAETVMAEGPEPDPSKTRDIVMLTVTGGRERTPSDFVALFRRTGFELTTTVRTQGSMSIVTARAAS